MSKVSTKWVCRLSSLEQKLYSQQICENNVSSLERIQNFLDCYCKWGMKRGCNIRILIENWVNAVGLYGFTTYKNTYTIFCWNIDGDHFLGHRRYLTDRIRATRDYNQSKIAWKHTDKGSGRYSRKNVHNWLQANVLLLHDNAMVHKIRKNQPVL